MKFENIKHKIDSYFEKVKPEEIIEGFKSYGYKFEAIDNDVDYQINISSLNSHSYISLFETSLNILDNSELLIGKVEYYKSKCLPDSYSNSGENNYSLAA
jgi:hypothetical protein